MNGLNAQQRAAVMTLNGPLMVLAGAGTGKTRVITYRIANLVRHGIRPDRILGVTFTNKAAREMRERTLKLVGSGDNRAPLIGTFHSLCVGILRQEITRLGYPKQFVIYDRGDQESAARTALREAKIAPSILKPAELLYSISRWKMRSLKPEEAVEEAELERDRIAARAYCHYQAYLKSTAALDFDDLLGCTEELFETAKDVLARQQSRFDHILIDEYQDTNASQYRIIKQLCERHENLCVVGDDDQSIYAWRGAEPKHLLAFQSEFPSARIVRLEENYRSCPNILAFANRLIGCNIERHEKKLRATRGAVDQPRLAEYQDEVEEARNVARDIIATITKEKSQFRDFAVLFRTNEQPRVFESEFRSHAIPYVLVGGYSFFDRKEIRDVLAYLKTVWSPSDETSLLRIINTPARGLGTAITERLIERAVTAGRPVWEVLPEAIADNSLPSKASSALQGFVVSIEKYRKRLADEPLVDAARDLLKEVNYRGEIARRYQLPADQESRLAAVGELLNMIEQYERRSASPSLGGFLEQVALDARPEESDDASGRNAVSLMTLHSAKGLEFPIVYLVGMEEGLLPHERSCKTVAGVSEERRLAYVGVTRARDRLILTLAKRRSRFGRLLPAKPSRFLAEMSGRKPSSTESVKQPATRTRAKPKTAVRGFRKARYSRK